ncbi:MAG: sigma-70 family RNA polymerase sigma factor [Planctomycetes bacterium]|nr:sigma-70 family RNA polymerase sigma factor [Planctomycetota bacterium]
MTTVDGPFESLLRQRAFVRGVARAVLRDADLADDVVQQTWLAARGSGVEDASPGLLATIARRLAINLRRSRERRFEREQRAAVDSVVPSPQQILECEEERRRVVEAVLALDEPHRAVVLLRHFDELPPRAIAARLRIPVETVKTRLKRAQERLRHALALDGPLDATRARSWIALAGLQSPSLPLVASIGVLLMAFKFVAVVGLATAIVGVAWWAQRDPDPLASESALAPNESPSPAEVDSAIAPLAEQRELVDPASTVARERGLSGRVVDDRGQPIAAATIHVGVDSADPWSTEATTGTDGRFRVDGLGDVAAGAPLIVAITAARCVACTVKVRAPDVGIVPIGTLRLASGGTIRGRVVDQAGRVVAAADVVVGASLTQVQGAWLRAGLDRGVRATTDAAGRFALEGLAPGWVAVGARGADTWVGARDEIPVRAGAVTDDVELVVERPPGGVRLRGRLEDERGVPIPRARLEWEGEGRPDTAIAQWSWFSQIATDDAGSFDLTCGIDATHAIEHVAPDGRVVRREGLRAGGDDVVLRVPEVKRIEVRAIDARTQSVVELTSARIAVEAEDGGFGVTRSNGGLFVAVPSVPWRLTASALGYERIEVGPFPAAGPDAGIDLVLEPTACVEGVVVDANGVAIEGAAVAWSEPLPNPMEAFGFVVSWVTRSYLGVTSAADGTFSLPIPRDVAHAAMHVSAAGYATTRTELLELDGIRAASPRALQRVRLTRGGTLTGTVLVAPGIERAGIVVAASCGDGQPRMTRTDETGRYVLEHLAAGAWRVELRDGDVFAGSLFGTNRAAPPANAIVDDDRTTRLDLVLDTRDRATVTGSVRIDGRSLPDVRVALLERPTTATSNADAWSFARILAEPVEADADGAFTLESDTQGAAWLEIRIGADAGAVALRRALTLAPGEQRVDVNVNSGRLEVAAHSIDPVRGTARVTLTRSDADGWTVRAEKFVKEPATITFPTLPGGTWWIVEQDGEPRSVVVTTGETTRVELP